MFTDGGHIRIIDFGLLRAGMWVDTQAGGFQGTLPYIEPEVYREEPHNRMVERWSHGVCLYELSHGRLPFTPREDAKLRFHILFKAPTFDHDINCNLVVL